MTLLSEKGITLVELLTVVVIMTVLFSIATLSFKSMRANQEIDRQARELYADLLKARSDALFKKTDRSVKLTGTSLLEVYPTSDCTGSAILQKNFPDNHPVLSNDDVPLAFDNTGVASAEKAYCVGPAGNSAGVDSVVVATTSIMLGKLRGGACSSDNIDAR